MTIAPNTALNRADIVKIIGPEVARANPKLVRGLEDVVRNTAASAVETANNVAATQAIQDATVLTLSPNATLNRERVFAHAPGITFTDNGPGETFVIGLAFPIVLNGGFRCTFNLRADTNLDMPSSGRVPSSADGPFANDAAAAAAGINIGEIYLVTGGTVAWRQT